MDTVAKTNTLKQSSLAIQSPKNWRPSFWFPYIVLAPMILWALIFVVYPVLYSIWVSFHLWVAEDPSLSQFVGLENYINLFTEDRRFPTAFANTLKYSGVVTVVCLVFGFIIANILVRVNANQTYLFAFFLPSLVPPAVVGVVFNVFFQPAYGLANFLLVDILGFEPLLFLKDPSLAIWTVAIVEIWMKIGFVILISYAGLLELPPQLFEAARIDGASEFQMVWLVTLPLMRRVLLFVTVVTLLQALQAFDLIYVMTAASGSGGTPGGPGISTYTLALLVYNEGLIRFQFGTASATANILYVLVFVATLFQIRLFRDRSES